ncbi:MAG: M50 family metallopeptidase, partial [Verrucomicrobiota bacterium]|nr:M50 family metallopeptidase [Verrucomicrobiota bacterium]
MLRFRLFGFPVTVEPWHWAILALIGGGLGIRVREDILGVILFMVAGFVSILIHELGHAFMSRLFGCRHVAIVLHGMGGVAISQGARFNRGQDILVSAAGPGLQAFCGGVALVLLLTHSFDGPAASLLYAFVGVSLFWALLNLIPVHPLDGGQILREVLGPRRIQLTLKISIVVAVIVGVPMFLLTSSLLFPIFLGLTVWQNYKML